MNKAFDPAKVISEIDVDTSSRPEWQEGKEYEFIVLELTCEELKSGNGHALSIKMECTNPEQKSQWIWDNLNLSHTNATAVQIAEETYARYAVAAGLGPHAIADVVKGELNDSEKIVGTCLSAKLKQSGDFLNVVASSIKGATAPKKTIKEQAEELDGEVDLPF